MGPSRSGRALQAVRSPPSRTATTRMAVRRTGKLAPWSHGERWITAPPGRRASRSRRRPRRVGRLEGTHSPQASWCFAPARCGSLPIPVSARRAPPFRYGGPDQEYVPDARGAIGELVQTTRGALSRGRRGEPAGACRPHRPDLDRPCLRRATGELMTGRQRLPVRHWASRPRRCGKRLNGSRR